MTAGGVVTIRSHGRSYQIHNPGAGRVGSKLAQGIPYERKLLEHIAERRLTGTAFDIGAHIGNHSLFLAAICGLRVHAWEPSDRSRMALQRNVMANPMLDVTIHGWAAGAEDTRGRYAGAMAIEVDGCGPVEVRRIDDHLDVDDLAVIKVDVEGMEADALAGCVRHIERCRPLIFAEAHTEQSSSEVGAVLEPLGYQSAGFIRMGSPMQRWEPR